ncbi:MAG: CAP domain-containing protein [Paludibacteraceae bacterium]|nr:CAP domain-containing protein [Paludibacteraceae bacterium]
MNKWFFMAAALTLMAPSCDEQEDDDPDSVENDDQNGDSNGNSSKSEVQKACTLINNIRKNPSSYSSEMGVDLSGVKSRSALSWNSALAKVAQAKAEDMAENNYFSHTDLNGYGVNYYMYKAGYSMPESWYSSKGNNYFENIAAGNATAEAMVKQLVYDSGASNSSAGHRSSLLGISDWNSNCTDIGIGYAYNANSTYKHYWSVIIAKHDY